MIHPSKGGVGGPGPLPMTTNLTDPRYDKFFDGLNDVQRDVVAKTEGRFLVLASAGSGKTRALTRRVGYLIAQGIAPYNIMCVTFTNKAANEMKDRIRVLVGDLVDDLWIGTFHSLCLRILQRNRATLGLESLTILDPDDQSKLLKEVIDESVASVPEDMAAAYIEKMQAANILPEEIQDTRDHDLISIYRGYQERKREMGYMDFNDILVFASRLMRDNHAIREKYQAQFRYVMCDEAQDVNDVQFQLLGQFSARHGNLSLTGDDFQAIYGWRGSNVLNIMNYSATDGLEVIRMEQNYRSSRCIVEASNALIGKNSVQLDKSSFTENAAGESIVVYPADNEAHEADFVASVVTQMRRDGVPLDDIAILSRTNRQVRHIEQAFSQLRIGYRLINGTGFFDRREIKDLIAYLRVVDNINDTLAFERIINVPKRGIGAATVEKIAAYADSLGVSFGKALNHVEEVPKLGKALVQKIVTFRDDISGIRSLLADPTLDPTIILNQLILRTGFLSQFQLGKNAEDDEQRIANITDFQTMATQWYLQHADDELDEGQTLLNKFLMETSLYTQMDDEDGQAVTIMSAHSSKGLEFKNVFIIGAEEGVFPHRRSMNEHDIEEERRLMYVAMTRAEHRLFISYSKLRFENKTERKTRPSRFLSELPRDLLHVVGID